MRTIARYRFFSSSINLFDEKEFAPEALQELADSIVLYGVMTPIVVARQDDDNYIIRQGERRYRASLLAGKKDIPAIIDSSNDKILEKQLIENIARENLSLTEIAKAVKYLIDVKKIKKIDLAKALAKSNAFVSNYYAFATFVHPLKEIILAKTQDLIVIAEFKRLLKNPSDEALREMTNFIKARSSINRDDMVILKSHIEYIDETEKETPEDLVVEFNDNNNNNDDDVDTDTNIDTDQTSPKERVSANKTPALVESARVFELLEQILPVKIAKETIKKLKEELGV